MKRKPGSPIRARTWSASRTCANEVDRQIRHLQRQAGPRGATRGSRTRSGRALAELLALKMRDLDSGAQIQDNALRERDVAMQSALADQRSSEAALEKQRAIHTERAQSVQGAQGRHYEIGAGHHPHRTVFAAHPRNARAAAHRPHQGARAIGGTGRAHRT